MGGKQEVSSQQKTTQATQEQLRLARITQDAHRDDDHAHIQKLVKKVVEAARCTVTEAEIALYDADNDVSAAIMTVLEQPNSDDWQQQKSRKAKKQDIHTDDDETHGGQQHQQQGQGQHSRGGDKRHIRNGSNARNGPNGTGGGDGGGGAPRFRGRGGGPRRMADRPERPERSERLDREDEIPGENSFGQVPRREDQQRPFRARGARFSDRARPRGDRGSRGRFTERGGKGATLGSIGTWNENNNSANTWDNSMASGGNKGGEGGETAKSDMMWQNSMASGLHNGGEDWTAADDASEDTEWKNVKTLVFETRRKEEGGGGGEKAGKTSTQSFAAVAGMPKPQVEVSHGQRTPTQSESPVITGPDTPNANRQSNFSHVQDPGGLMSSLLSQSSQPPQQRESPSGQRPPSKTAASDWTQQLKTDLGIGQTIRQSATVTSSEEVQRQQTQTQGRQSTVEFVSDGGRGGSAGGELGSEYQFGFVESGHQEPCPVSLSQPSLPSNNVSVADPSTAILFPARTPSKNETVVNGSVQVSKESPKPVPSSASNPIPSYAPVLMPNAPVVSAPKVPSLGPSGVNVGVMPSLTYAETTTMSYPDNSRTYSMINQMPSSASVSATFPSTGVLTKQQMQPVSTTGGLGVNSGLGNNKSAQQIAAGQMFNPALYNPSFPYMNMYSPVTNMRPDDPHYAALFQQQYPFPMPPLADFATMPTGLPPVSQATVRNDQNTIPSYVADFKPYSGSVRSSEPSTSVGNAVAPPPGFSGPPAQANAVAAQQAQQAAQAAFGFTQPTISSLFAVPPTYGPQHAIPGLQAGFMLPNISGAGQTALTLQQKNLMQFQSTFDEQTQATNMGGQSQQQGGQDYGNRSQAGGGQPNNPMQTYGQQQTAGQPQKNTYGTGAADKNVYGHKTLQFDRSSYGTQATNTPPPGNPMAAAGGMSFPPNAAAALNASVGHFGAGFQTNANFMGQLQQLSPMPNIGHMHDNRSGGQSSGKHGGATMGPAKYAQGGYGGGWA